MKLYEKLNEQSEYTKYLIVLNGGAISTTTKPGTLLKCVQYLLEDGGWDLQKHKEHYRIRLKYLGRIEDLYPECLI